MEKAINKSKKIQLNLTVEQSCLLDNMVDQEFIRLESEQNLSKERLAEFDNETERSNYINDVVVRYVHLAELYMKLGWGFGLLEDEQAIVT
jgi:hypothetical protein